jgi:hypothetical protein
MKNGKHIHQLHNPYTWFLGIFVCLWSLGQLQRFQMSSGVVIYVHDVVVVFTCFFFLSQNSFILSKLQRGINELWQTSLGKSLLLFGVWTMLGLGWACLQGVDIVRPILYSVRICFYAGFWLSLIYSKALSRRDVQLALIAGSCLMTLLATAQYLFLPDLRFLRILGWDDHYYRLVGPILDPNFMGAVLILSWWYILDFTTLKHRGLKPALLIWVVTALILTYSRASYLAWILPLLLGAVLHFKKISWQYVSLFILAILVSLSFIWFFNPGGEGTDLLRITSIQARLESLRLGFSSLQLNELLLGKGFFVSYKEASLTNPTPDHALSPDNWPIAILAGTGIIGLVLFLLSLALGLRNLMKKSSFISLAVISILIHGLFNNTLFEPFILLWMLGGIATILIPENSKAKLA